MFRDLRIRIFNWFAAGRMTLVNETTEYKPMSSYTLGAGNGIGAISINTNTFSNDRSVNLRITPANGGTIISIQTHDYSNHELHIIPDDADFDRELGKIITMNKLKS